MVGGPVDPQAPEFLRRHEKPSPERLRRGLERARKPGALLAACAGDIGQEGQGLFALARIRSWR